METIKKAKKVNPKVIAKKEVMEIIRKALEENGIEFKDGVDYGMTTGTIIVPHKITDIQIRPIYPRAGLDRYAVVKCTEEE